MQAGRLEILTLRKLHGLSHREIAARLGIAENTVNALAALGVLRCREYLESKGLAREPADEFPR